MSQDDKNQLSLFAYECLSLRNNLALGTSILTPINYVEEKEKFFSSNTYNPIFYYNHYDANLDDKIKNLRVLLKDLFLPREIKEYLRDYIVDLALIHKSLHAIGSDMFWTYSRLLFDFVFTQDLVSIPISHKKSARKHLMHADEISVEFDKVLRERYDIHDVSIIIDEFNPKIIRVGLRSIVIGKNVKRFADSVDRLIVHEVESHMLQNHNLSSLNNPLLFLSQYAESRLFGEGLAVFNEHSTGTLTDDAYKNYYCRLQATKMINQSFREIYTFLCESVSEKKAYDITYRIKRGLHDTSRAGGFPKDAMYLLGYSKIKEYIQSGLQPEYLYISKDPHLTQLLMYYGLINTGDVKLPQFLAKQN